MKIIDLLVKKAKGEEMPKYIHYRAIYTYDKDLEDYIYEFYDGGVEEIEYLFYRCDLPKILNDEIEIIEEKPKKIEELEDIEECFAGVGIEYNENAPQYKINQLIRNQKNIVKAVNYLLEKESDK